jgi:hypothetical protein
MFVKSSLRISFVALVGCAGLATSAAARAQTKGAACDRACLGTVLDQYLAAVVKHDPAAAPLVIGYRHTENAVNKKLGDGVWKTATGLGKVQRRYFDPVSGQAGYYGYLEEGDKHAVVTARLRIENRRIVEAEWYVARDGDPGLPTATPPNLWSATNLAASPPPERTLTKAQRLPREAMIAIVNSYFDGIVSHDGSVVLARPGCERYENGTRVTGIRNGVAADCVSGLQNFNLQNVAARRVDFVDEEAGVVLGMGVFIRKAGSPVRRNAFSEWFVIQDGRIQDLWTAMYYPDANLPVPNWPPFDGNFPLPAFTTLPQ